MRAATPADALAVWTSIEKAGGQPTTRTVTDALNASGEFEPVNKSTIARWHKDGFRPLKALKGLAKAATAVEAALPALTGEATKRTTAFVMDDDGLNEKSDADLARALAREAAITSITLMRQLREECAMIPLVENLGIGTLVQALAGQMQTVNEVIGVPGPKTAGGRVIEHEPEVMNDALAAFREARARAN